MWIEDSLYADIKRVMPIATVDIVVIRKSDEKVLLLKRNNEPVKGKWWIPGGRINKGEEILDAAIRKLKEETGIYAKQLGIIMGALSMNFGSVHTITVATYLARLDETPEIVLNNEHSEFCWAREADARNLLGGPVKLQYIAALRSVGGVRCPRLA